MLSLPPTTWEGRGRRDASLNWDETGYRWRWNAHRGQYEPVYMRFGKMLIEGPHQYLTAYNDRLTELAQTATPPPRPTERELLSRDELTRLLGGADSLGKGFEAPDGRRVVLRNGTYEISWPGHPTIHGYDIVHDGRIEACSVHWGEGDYIDVGLWEAGRLRRLITVRPQALIRSERAWKEGAQQPRR